jgi:UDP-N-acetylmuramate dehydrogenase
MNAGAFGGVTWEHVVAVETIDRAGKLHIRQPSEFEIRYREIKKPAEEWFIAGHFRFAKTSAAISQQAIKELLRKRSETQPIGEFSCGSVFRNPPQDHAARLIEASGLKGKKIGGAWVSEKHANFIINGGEATAKDIETLIGLVQQTVQKSQHVCLIPECHIIGEGDE